MNFKSFKLWLNVITIIALAVLVFASRKQIADAFAAMADLNFFWLFLIIPLQLINYSSVGMFYKTQLRNLGVDTKFKDTFKVALEMNFVNNVFPSGGVSGFGYFGVRMKKLGVPGSKSTLTQVMRHATTFLSFTVFMIIALGAVTFVGSTTRFIVLVSASIVSAIFIGTALMAYIISSEARIKAFTAAIPRALNYFGRKLLRGKVPRINVERIENLFSQLHHDYVVLKKDWRKLRVPFMWSLLMNLTEILTITVVYYAFGSTVNIGAVIIAYAVANMAGLVAILPGGVGIYEGLMTAVLAAAGIPRGLALSATVVYRALNMALFLPVGFVLYQMNLRDSNTEVQKPGDVG